MADCLVTVNGAAVCGASSLRELYAVLGGIVDADEWSARVVGAAEEYVRNLAKLTPVVLCVPELCDGWRRLQGELLESLKAAVRDRGPEVVVAAADDVAKVYEVIGGEGG